MRSSGNRRTRAPASDEFVSLKDPVYTCDVCKRNFLSQWKKNSHIKQMHTRTADDTETVKPSKTPRIETGWTKVRKYHDYRRPRRHKFNRDMRNGRFCPQPLQTCPASESQDCAIGNVCHPNAQTNDVVPCASETQSTSVNQTSMLRHQKSAKTTKSRTLGVSQKRRPRNFATTNPRCTRSLKDAEHLSLNDRKHKCELCNKEFSYLSRKMRHFNKMHGKTTNLQNASKTKVGGTQKSHNSADTTNHIEIQETAIRTSTQESLSEHTLCRRLDFYHTETETTSINMTQSPSNPQIFSQMKPCKAVVPKAMQRLAEQKLQTFTYKAPEKLTNTEPQRNLHIVKSRNPEDEARSLAPVSATLDSITSVWGRIQEQNTSSHQETLNSSSEIPFPSNNWWHGPTHRNTWINNSIRVQNSNSHITVEHVEQITIVSSYTLRCSSKYESERNTNDVEKESSCIKRKRKECSSRNRHNDDSTANVDITAGFSSTFECATHEKHVNEINPGGIQLGNLSFSKKRLPAISSDAEGPRLDCQKELNDTQPFSDTTTADIDMMVLPSSTMESTTHDKHVSETNRRGLLLVNPLYLEPQLPAISSGAEGPRPECQKDFLNNTEHLPGKKTETERNVNVEKEVTSTQNKTNDSQVKRKLDQFVGHKCKVCSWWLLKSTDMSLHIFSAHPEVGRLMRSCIVPLFGNPHVQHLPYKCAFCNYITINERSYVLHYKNHTKGKSPYTCQVCRAKRETYKTLIKHYKTEHLRGHILFEKNEDACAESYIFKEEIRVVPTTPLFIGNKNNAQKESISTYSSTDRSLSIGVNMCHSDSPRSIEGTSGTRKICPTSAPHLTSGEKAKGSQARFGFPVYHAEYNPQNSTFPSLTILVQTTHYKKLANQNCLDKELAQLGSRVDRDFNKTTKELLFWFKKIGLLRIKNPCETHPDKICQILSHKEPDRVPFSAGFGCIFSTCCPEQERSIYFQSIFEGSNYHPRRTCYLISQWVKQADLARLPNNLRMTRVYIRNFFAILRAVCISWLHEMCPPLGGETKYVEIGVKTFESYSGGRTTNVVILGVFDPQTKVVRMKVINSLEDQVFPDQASKSNRANIDGARAFQMLWSLAQWVDKQSILVVDPTIDKGLLNEIGFMNIQPSYDGEISNAHILKYLEETVTKSFQRAFSRISKTVLQQFLDEISWREMHGQTPLMSYQNLLSHLSTLTSWQLHPETLITRLNKVHKNPFIDWSHTKRELRCPKNTFSPALQKKPGIKACIQFVCGGKARVEEAKK